MGQRAVYLSILLPQLLDLASDIDRMDPICDVEYLLLTCLPIISSINERVFINIDENSKRLRKNKHGY